MCFALPHACHLSSCALLQVAAGVSGEGGGVDVIAAATAAGLAASSAMTSGTVGSGSPCVGAFRALKRLVANWHADQAVNPYAAQLLARFYTWIASPVSLLHDPASRWAHAHPRLAHIPRRRYDAPRSSGRGHSPGRRTSKGSQSPAVSIPRRHGGAHVAPSSVA